MREEADRSSMEWLAEAGWMVPRHPPQSKKADSVLPVPTTKHQRLEKALANLPGATVFLPLSADEQIIGNSAAAAMLGVALPAPSTAELLGRFRRLRGGEFSIDGLLRERMMPDPPLEPEEVIFERPERGALCLEVRAAALRDMHGTVSGILLFFEDVTERRRTEQLQGEYTSLIAHDLRAPLNAMRLQVEVVRRRLRRVDADAESEVVEPLMAQLYHLELLVQDLLDTARVESGQLRLDVQVTDVRSLLTDVIRAVVSTHDAARLQVVLPDQATLVPVDARRIKRVFANLLNNALKYSPAHTLVAVRMHRQPGQVSISIANSGQGIQSEHLPYIFDKFYRVDAGQQDGVGLGLYISQLLARAHRGQIVVDSQPGVGCTFTLELPAPRG